jgi:5-methylcytosine-specific restriction protein A
MARSVPEWIGATPDTKIPDRVMVRIFLRNDGRCACCNRRITSGEKWQADHKIALANGGLHVESNLQPLLVEHHKAKTREDVAEKARTYRKVKKHIGVKKPSRFPGSRDGIWKKKINGQVVLR